MGSYQLWCEDALMAGDKAIVWVIWTRVTICDCNSSHVVNCKKGFITSFYCICGSWWLNNRWETQPRFLISTSSLMEWVKAEGVTSWPVSRAESIIRVGTPLNFCAWLVHSFLSDHRRWCLLLRGWSQNPGNVLGSPWCTGSLSVRAAR